MSLNSSTTKRISSYYYLVGILLIGVVLGFFIASTEYTEDQEIIQSQTETIKGLRTDVGSLEIQIEELKEEVAISKKEKNIGSNNNIEDEITQPRNKEVVLSENQKDKEQAELTELKHKDHLSDKQSEEDLLEIPAFLRRQAN